MERVLTGELREIPIELIDRGLDELLDSVAQGFATVFGVSFPKRPVLDDFQKAKITEPAKAKPTRGNKKRAHG
ncbi:MAG: hypothetical protein WBR15_02960 [Gammaproteobacteria bacterium]